MTEEQKELREAVAREAARRVGAFPWFDPSEAMKREQCLCIADAAISVALERAARVVDNMSRVKDKAERERIYKIAAAIRALIKEK